MGSLDNFARSAAAGGGGMGADPSMPPDAGMEPPMDDMGAAPGGDVVSAIDGVEAAFEGSSDDVREEASKHLAALRELASQMDVDAETEEAEQPLPDAASAGAPAAPEAGGGGGGDLAALLGG